MSLGRLMTIRISRRATVMIPLKDLFLLESVFFSMAETQSLEMWLIATLLMCLRKELPEGSNLPMYGRLCQTFSVTLHSWGAKSFSLLGLP